MLGHTKLISVLVSGYVLFAEPASLQNIVGVLMAVVGIMWYTQLKVNENARTNDADVNTRGRGKKKKS